MRSAVSLVNGRPGATSARGTRCAVRRKAISWRAPTVRVRLRIRIVGLSSPKGVLSISSEPQRSKLVRMKCGCFMDSDGRILREKGVERK